MNKKSLLIIAVSVLVIALIGITYLLFTEKQSNHHKSNTACRNNRPKLRYNFIVNIAYNKCKNNAAQG